jgi:hypothetical protein
MLDSQTTRLLLVGIVIVALYRAYRIWVDSRLQSRSMLSVLIEQFKEVDVRLLLIRALSYSAVIALIAVAFQWFYGVFPDVPGILLAFSLSFIILLILSLCFLAFRYILLGHDRPTRRGG